MGSCRQTNCWRLKVVICMVGLRRPLENLESSTQLSDSQIGRSLSSSTDNCPPIRGFLGCHAPYLASTNPSSISTILKSQIQDLPSKPKAQMASGQGSHRQLFPHPRVSMMSCPLFGFNQPFFHFNNTEKPNTRFAIQAKGPDGKWTRKPLAYRESNNVHLFITRPPEICVNLVFKHIHAASSYTICRQFVPFIYCPL